MNLTEIKRVVIGKPFSNSAEVYERLDIPRGLAIFASDPISSNAYATEAIMTVLVLLGSGALQLTLPVAVGITLLVTMVIFSYVQTIWHYPGGGGAYIVAKDNLGQVPAMIAAAALLTDYVLTVSVSVSAGVRAVTSAFPAAYNHRVLIAIAVIVIITWLKLRGVRESGTMFALPTYAFVIGVLAVVCLGLVRHFGLFNMQPLPEPGYHVQAALPVVTQFAYVWLLLRAFAAGCTALTGIEAISNGVQAFRAPESLNAVRTMIAMGLMAMSLFLGISFLSTQLALVPTEANSILSQMTYAVTGGGPVYYWVQFFTMMILFLAANTGFQGFPRLSSLLAKDNFLPRWLQNRGDRLVYSWGIALLAAISSAIVILFRADEIAMLPLYALGVMLSFTLSQAGMVRLMGRVAKVPPGQTVHTDETTIHYESGWWWKRGVNLVGSIVTGVVLLILVVTKFVEGAWIIVVTIPALVMLFRTINNHYLHVAEGLRPGSLRITDLEETADIALVPVADVHRGTLRAIKYAKSLGKQVRAVSIITNPEQKERIRRRWQQFSEATQGVELVLIDYEYRDIFNPLLEYVEYVNNVEFPHQLTTVVIPEFIPESLAAQSLHNQTANLLQLRLRHYEDIVIVHVLHHL